MPEKLLIEIEAQDKASAAIRGVASATKTELKGISDSGKSTGTALDQGMTAGATAVKGVGTAAGILTDGTNEYLEDLGYGWGGQF